MSPSVIREPAVTVLTITHRLTTARQADHVVVLDQGAVGWQDGDHLADVVDSGVRCRIDLEHVDLLDTVGDVG